jgi:putative transposase
VTPDDQFRRNDTFPERRHPNHGVQVVDGQPTIVYVTVCTKGRRPWLATAAVHDRLCEVWRAATAWLVGRYVVMPDHLHFFAGMTHTDIPLDNWVRYWKSLFSKRHKDPSCRWHPDHWDTRLRRGESYDQKWEYVWNNPVRHDLMQRAEDWPYQGVIHDLPW